MQAGNLASEVGSLVFADGTTLAVNNSAFLNGAAANQATTDEANLKPLSTVTIIDPNPGVTESSRITLTGTSGVATDADGVLFGTGLTKIGTGLYTLAAATPASLASELEALTFTPTAHQVAPGSTVTTTINVGVTQNGLTTANTTTSIIATAVNDAPSIARTRAGQTTTDEASLSPFSGTTIGDLDVGVTDSVAITLSSTLGIASDADGTLSGVGLTKTGTGLYTLASATPGSLTSELDALKFTPTARQVAVGQAVTTGFSLSVTQNGLTTNDTATSVVATAVGNPIITGAVAGQAVTDEATLTPFSAVQINNASSAATESATITLSSTAGSATDADGTLSGTGLTKTGTGLYTLAAATPSSLVSELEALVFTPTAHQVAPGSNVTTTIDLGVTQSGLTTANTTTSIIATALNDAPSVAGTRAGQATTDEANLSPFSATTIADLDTGVVDSLTVILTGTAGTATDADGTLSGTGLTKIGTGLYTLSAATPASLTSELEALKFTPTARQVGVGQTVITGFSLSVMQNGLTTNNTATSVIATAISNPIITGAVAGQAVTDEKTLKPFSTVQINNASTTATESATITLSSTTGAATDADGTLSGTGLTKTGAGLYMLAAVTPASLVSELEALVFTPTTHQVAPGGTVISDFMIVATQSGASTANTIASVIATAVNDAPVIAGAKASQVTTDEASLNPLSAVTITDPDIGVMDSVTITLTGAGGFATDADGSLSGAGLTKSGTGLYTLAATTPASLTSELEALTFTPTAHQVAPGSTVTTTIDLGVTQNGLTSTNTATSISATAVNDAPVIAGTKAGQATTDENSPFVFSGTTITDLDFGVSDTMSITLTNAGGTVTDADGTLTGTGLTKTGTGIYTLAAATPVSLTSELDAVKFVPTAHQVSPGGTVVANFKLSATQNSLTSNNTITSVIVAAVNDAPIIAGAKAGQTTTDEAALKPLSAVTITDPDLGVSDSVTITLTGASGVATDADGTLSGIGLTNTGTGLYTLAAATPVSLTSELAALTFTPTAHQVTPGTTVLTNIDLAVTQKGLTSTSTLSSVVATAANDAAAIAGTKVGQTTTDEAILHPFSGTTITDADLGVTETITITVKGTAGTATDANGLLSGTGLTKTGTGVYTFAATTPASLTSELDALNFTPTAHQVIPGVTIITGLTLAVTQNSLTTTNTTTSVLATAINDAPVISGAQAGQTTVDYVSLKPLSNVTISDVDFGVTESVTITLDNSSRVASDANGTLSGTGLTKTGTGLYTLAAASAASLTSELEALVFTPTQHEVAAGSTVASGFILTARQISGGTTVSSTNTTASLIVTALNYITGPTAGNTIISGTSGNDVINASGTLNTIISNGGNDFINAGSGRATVNAGAGNDVIVLGGASNTVTGTNGNDTVSGASGGLSHIMLGNGNDMLSIGGSGDTITLGTGTDLINGVVGTFYVSTGSGADTFDFAAGSLTSTGTISAGAGNDVISFTTAGTIAASVFTSVTGIDTIDLFSGTNSLTISDAIVASSDFQTLTVIGGIGNEVINASSVKAGHSVTLSAGPGNSTLLGGAGNDLFSAGAGHNTFVGGGGIDNYDFAVGSGTLSINNSISGGTAAAGRLDFGAGITEQNLWFIESGNNLIIDRLGSSDQVTIQNWFGTNASAKLSEIIGSDGLEIDTGLANLVSAMAVFSTDNGSFNPVTATQMPSNSVLQAAIAANWHS